MDDVINPAITTTLPDYCHRYGWLADPFCIQNDKIPFYVPPYWDNYLDLIQYIQKHENAMITIMGPSGSGKSTFLTQFLLQIDSSDLTSLFDAKMPVTSTILIEKLCATFLSHTPIGDSLEDQLDNLLNAIQFKSQHFLLIIDNAEHLSGDVLQTLLYCIEQQTDYQMRLHIILAGDMSLKQLLDTTCFSRTKQINIRTLMLQQLKPHEIQHYLQHRINNISDKSQNPFTDDFIKYIHSESNGYPYAINLKAKQVLANGFNTNIKKNHPPKSKTSTSYQSGLITLCVIIVIIIVAMIHLPAKKGNVIQGTLYNDNPVSPQKSVVNSTIQKKPSNALDPNSNLNSEHGVQLNQSQLNSINNLNLLTNPVKVDQPKTVPIKSARIKNANKNTVKKNKENAKENKIQIINANLS